MSAAAYQLPALFVRVPERHTTSIREVHQIMEEFGELADAWFYHSREGKQFAIVYFQRWFYHTDVMRDDLRRNGRIFIRTRYGEWETSIYGGSEKPRAPRPQREQRPQQPRQRPAKVHPKPVPAAAAADPSVPLPVPLPEIVVPHPSELVQSDIFGEEFNANEYEEYEAMMRQQAMSLFTPFYVEHILNGTLSDGANNEFREQNNHLRKMFPIYLPWIMQIPYMWAFLGAQDAEDEKRIDLFNHTEKCEEEEEQPNAAAAASFIAALAAKPEAEEDGEIAEKDEDQGMFTPDDELYGDLM